jgi:hypothetical protein
LKRKGLSPEGRRRISAATLAFRPWRFSTGPRTPEGKARSAANGRRQLNGRTSVRELRAEMNEISELISGLDEARQMALTPH